MLHQKNEFSQLDAPFLDKSKEDINGKIVEIMSEGLERPNRFGDNEKMQTVIKIKTTFGLRYIALNQKSINSLIEEFGSNNDSDWIGKSAKALVNPTVIGGKKVKVLFLLGQGWELDEYGDPVNPGAQPAQVEDEVIDEGNPDDIGEPPF